MAKFALFALLFFSLFTTSAQQKVILDENFRNNKNDWKLLSDKNFNVAIKNGFLHLEKFERNRIKNGCLWYNKEIKGFNTLNDFSITLYAKFLNGGDIFDMIDLQWGSQKRLENKNITGDLYQLSFFMNGGTRLDYFNQKWTYFVKKDIQPTLAAMKFNAAAVNKYDVIQQGGFVIVKVNDQEVSRQLSTPIAGSSIGFQQCLKAAWEIDRIVIKQGRISTVKTQPLAQARDQVQPLSPNDDVVIYPNPFKDIFSITFTLKKDETVVVALIDMKGVVLQQHTRQLAAGKQKIDMYADVPTGSYVVKVTGNGKTTSRIIIKN